MKYVCLIYLLLVAPLAFGEVIISKHFAPAAHTVTDVDDEDVLDQRERFDFSLEDSFSGRFAFVDKQGNDSIGWYVDVSRYRLNDESETDTYQTLAVGGLGMTANSLTSGVDTYLKAGIGLGGARFRISESEEHVYGHVEGFLEAGLLLGEHVLTGMGLKASLAGFPGETVANSGVLYFSLGLYL